MTDAILKRPGFGLTGFVMALIALVIAVLQVSAMMEPPAEPPGRTIGQIAADIRDGARAAISGEETAPPPVAEPSFSRTEILAAIGAVLGGLGAVIGAIGIFRGEPMALAGMAIGFGVGAIVMQYVFWLAVMICGALLLIAIVNNIGDILG